MGQAYTAEGWRNCDSCGHRLARWRGQTVGSLDANGDVQALTLHTCGSCKYKLQRNIEPFNQTAESQAAGASGIPCESASETVALQDTNAEVARVGYMTYALGVECSGCDRVFARLVLSKQSTIWIPQHSRVKVGAGAR